MTAEDILSKYDKDHQDERSYSTSDVLAAMEQYATEKTATLQKQLKEAKRWVSVKDRQPTKEQYYFVLRGGSNPAKVFNCHPAVHFWYADENKWSSETDYWLEDISRTSPAEGGSND